MKTITCPLCKDEILFVPDFRAMDKAISGHAKKKHPKIQYEVEDHLHALMFKVGHDAGKEANL
jgi:hypothetical protein